MDAKQKPKSKTLNGRRFGDLAKHDRTLFTSLLYVEKTRRAYRCTFDQALELLKKMHGKYQEEISCSLDVADIMFDILNEDKRRENEDEEEDDRDRNKNR